MNRMGLDRERALNFIPRGSTVWSTIALTAAWVAFLFNWFILYKERRPHPWKRMVGAGVLLGLAAWLSTGWLTDYRPRDIYDVDLPPSAQVWFTAGVVGAWAIFCAAWRYLDRYRRRPGWIFFGFAATFFMISMNILLNALGAISYGIIMKLPDRSWPGLEIFSREIYYLDKIPVYVDYVAIAWIVVWTLVVSFVWSIYPAIRAAAADPVEAIRDE
jgi:ABC-type antimicrobial peptide transport system permease subunit